MLANRFVRSRTATVPLLAGALFAVAGCTDSGSGGSAKAPSPSATSPAQEDETEGSAKDEPVGADYWTAKADVGIFLCGKSDAKQDRTPTPTSSGPPPTPRSPRS